MCARYSLTKEAFSIKIGDVEIGIQKPAALNILPRQKVPVIVPDHINKYKLVDMIWGWESEPQSDLLINAGCETIQSSLPFQNFIGNRCLIPADGFYYPSPNKDPIHFTKSPDKTFCFAGLWYESKSQFQGAEKIENKCVILTTTPNETVGQVHPRMPFIVQETHYFWWLDNSKMFQTVMAFPDRDTLNGRSQTGDAFLR